MAFSSPRPTPKFFTETATFSTKKARGTPRDSLPPKPPVKSAPPFSRIFALRLQQKALPVSFHKTNNTLLNPNYDEHNKEPYFNQCFEVVSKIGAGSFGEVYKVRSKADGQYYAVKKSREAFRGESDRKRKLEEVAKHEKLRHHPNCVKFCQAWEEMGRLYMQIELCKTSLYDFAEKNHNISETLIWKFLVDLLMALKHLHVHNLVHMDIKSENIFLSFDDICKLGDFGLVLDVSKGYDISDAQEGDPQYLAPELLEGKFGKPADIFSLGMTILELSSDLDLPRGGEGWHMLRHGQIPEEFLQGRSFDLKYVIRQMLDPDPTSRPIVEQLLAFPCVRKVYKKRIREYMISNIVSNAVHIMNSIMAFLFMLLTLIFTYPFSKLLYKVVCPVTSPMNATNPELSLVDYTVSDDETLDADVSSDSYGVPLDNSNSAESCFEGDTSGCGAFDEPVDNQCFGQNHKQKAYTTPILHRKRMLFHNSSKSASPGFPRKLDLVSSSSPKPVNTVMEGDGKENRPATPVMLLDEVRPIEPRNLLGMFDAACEEEL
ncbi:membrane-associated tyrosine- and threonine-specific cdc2-inhibitory kinase isoform X1 [Octopus bimaculoides]|nr:membrane-associated tyrosine- and threonine-specific cdc2-inhibitory kinase isoform X1 [Octopus bimaculoides]XP_014779410.1 membrane-associated tyrosine- and threonine-specific cdc2-inhibitory kinase isoform X1 [Octopus bimaculoides]XP_014779411.1 membrane-associated tyrosine- and threonine-specific cdc2-inhibitory kinase isoform X1 [Octopus bimaculoides]XP_052824793.1 membrane-associated tyrosine- and threonine-specific cdc2-inhibitory kinase isoform X1 [Octopus bimaculoides]|eukprot:XP_014779408.1 PREDICTED: membrane-associated tyrosine- and threonine-specific cdc2-inhibitory kinase-like isoform X1 [Octopus bimaculoides]